VARYPHLKRMQIEVSLRCNLSCGYCYSMSGPGHRNHLSTRQILSLIEQADSLGVLGIDFTGGELLLHPDWREMVALARSTGIAVTIHTNGTLIKQETAAALKLLGVGAIQVALDSHIAEIHDLSRGHRGALERTLRGLDLLAEQQLPTRLSIMAHRGNIDTLSQTIIFMRRRYPRAIINIDRVIATGGALSTDTGLGAQEFWEFLKPYLSSSVRAGRVCESPGSESFEPECGVAYSYVYITAQGEIAACPTMTSRESPAFQGPAIGDGPVGQALAHAWYDSAFFTGFRHTNCENVAVCPAGSACGGGCRSNAYAESGRVTAPDVVACNIRKNPTKVFVDFPKRYAHDEFGNVR
jgi:radical SAM protein with 4Fe4S-binding SPASM domain